jgi:cupin 2 domain-containing protein
MADMNQEFVEPLVKSGKLRIERIVSNGASSPEGYWYDQAEDEWVFLHCGTATLQFDDGRMVEMKAGDHLFIPAHSKHRVKCVSGDAVWIAMFVGEMMR